MLGVILCGGNSSRMGSDKGLLYRNEKAWVQIAHDKMSALSIPSVISINANQVASYSSLFPDGALIIDNAELTIGGPLLGLLSVHRLFPTEDLLLMACDLTEMQSKVMEQLISARYGVKDAEAFVFNNNGAIEPLCALYSAAGASKLLAAYHAQQLKKHSMHYALELLSIHDISLPHEWVPFFKNFNRASDLEE